MSECAECKHYDSRPQGGGAVCKRLGVSGIYVRDARTSKSPCGLEGKLFESSKQTEQPEIAKLKQERDEAVAHAKVMRSELEKYRGQINQYGECTASDAISLTTSDAMREIEAVAIAEYLVTQINRDYNTWPNKELARLMPELFARLHGEFQQSMAAAKRKGE